MSDHSTIPVEYRPIEGHPNYRVGSDGSVWSCWGRGGNIPWIVTSKWKKLKPFPTRKGRLLVTLSNHKAVQVHRLVLEAFVGLRPEGMECCHFPDRDITNNNLSNLRWGTKQENAADKLIHGTRPMGEKLWSAKLTEDKVLKIRALHAEKTHRVSELSRMFGISQSTVSNVIARRLWKHI